MKIDIIGPYPPPYGGISIHIQRILPILKEKGFEAKVYNQYSYHDINNNIIATKKSLTWWISYFFYKKPNIVHFHQFSDLHFPYVFFFSWFCTSKVFLTIHNQKLLESSSLKNFLSIFFLKHSRNLTIISVSYSIQKLLLNNKIKDVIYLPAYVPPGGVNNKSFNSSKHKKVLFNVWRVNNNEDIKKYGVDYLVKLADKYPNVNFFLFVGGRTSKFLENYIKTLNLNNLTLFFGESLVEYLSNADLFLRLNREDAYGISIQEALDLGVPAIASDVCKRPDGCILYKNDCFISLDNKFQHALIASRHDLLKFKSTTNYHIELVNLYKKKLGIHLK
jgi:hypothetical protein